MAVTVRSVITGGNGLARCLTPKMKLGVVEQRNPKPRDANVTRRALVSTAVINACLGLFAPPAAGAPDGPCTLELALVCRMMPIAPELDEDIDLTKQPTQTQTPPSAADPDAPPNGN